MVKNKQAGQNGKKAGSIIDESIEPPHQAKKAKKGKKQSKGK